MRTPVSRCWRLSVVPIRSAALRVSRESVPTPAVLAGDKSVALVRIAPDTCLPCCGLGPARALPAGYSRPLAKLCVVLRELDPSAASSSSSFPAPDGALNRSLGPGMAHFYSGIWIIFLAEVPPTSTAAQQTS